MGENLDVEEQCGNCGDWADYLMECGVYLCDRCHIRHQTKFSECEIIYEIE